ncbi:MAG TPA: ferrous iron transporter B [Methylococcaceae bacterium]|nr:ferrous iron transporter B [Methylococcaceae bacterium]
MNPKDTFIVGIVGNPNCGKTTLFNVLTGSKQYVGNWAGVTVEKKTGEYVFAGKHIQCVDLPGTYSLESSDDHVSLDEKIARDYVAQREADVIINIVDASNIERNLYLTSQLIEMRVPMIVVLNMMDAVKQRGIRIDIDAMATQLGCPVVGISAATKQGLPALKTAINQLAAHHRIPSITIPYIAHLEVAIAQLAPQLATCAENYPCDPRWLTLRLLENDTLARTIAGHEMVALAATFQRQIEEDTDDEIDILAADGRYGFVNQLTKQVVCKLSDVSRHTSEKIDRVVLNRFLGIPIFLLVMYLMFLFTINIGSAFVDFFEQCVGALLVDGLATWLDAVNCPNWLNVLLTQGVGSGIQVVATFIPIVGFLFLFLSVLEDSGYMARAAFVMDRFMRFLGLPGKAFVPMIVGFGCNVPAIMATRTLENPRDRILTNLMNPFMSCGARLPVYALFAAAFFPTNGQNIVFSLYLLGIGVAVCTGLIMRHTLFKGETTPFIMELPTYHLPTLQGILIRTGERLKSFIFNAGRLIVPMVLVLNFLNALGVDGRFGQENTHQSVLSAIGRNLTFAFEPMGITEENWVATVGIFTGVLAKEAVVGTLDALYSQLEQPVLVQEKPAFVMQDALMQAVETIPTNLALVASRLLDPLGLDVGALDSLQQAADKQNVHAATFQSMQHRFDGQVGAFAYLLFILLYSPCVAATAAIYRETSAAWAAFAVMWTTGVAYFTATLFYQIATYPAHPEQTRWWIAIFMTVSVIVIAILWQKGRYGVQRV